MLQFIVGKSTHFGHKTNVIGITIQLRGGFLQQHSMIGLNVCFWFILRKLVGKKVIIGDNLSTHLSQSIFQKSCEENIHFVCFPLNSTYLIQIIRYTRKTIHTGMSKMTYAPVKLLSSGSPMWTWC